MPEKAGISKKLKIKHDQHITITKFLHKGKFTSSKESVGNLKKLFYITLSNHYILSFYKAQVFSQSNLFCDLYRSDLKFSFRLFRFPLEDKITRKRESPNTVSMEKIMSNIYQPIYQKN